jgi:L-seryl-tRNA(Ser) seleniumtransferase
MGDQDQLRQLPAISALLEEAESRGLMERHARQQVTEALRQAVEELRERLRSGEAVADGREAALERAEGLLLAAARQGLRRVINATGVIVHTNLGRSLMSEAAARAAYEVATSYSNLEADLEAGKRSSRHVHVEARLKRIVGAPAGAVFNNNAAAVMLALGAVAQGREVIVSRGQLVEIGGSFRIPEVIVQSGCILREVGSTNRTHLRDYERAIGENTAAILRVHPSNYRVIGFTTEPSLAELAELAHSRGLPVIDDIGSGALLDLAALGVGGEPTVAQSLAAGMDLVTFSGDKLMGGPQCGIAVGRPELVERMKKHPLARALRVDKMTLAALAATLDLLAEPERALREIPTLRMATEPLAAVRARADKLAEAIAAQCGPEVVLEVVEDRAARVGGGSLAEQELPTAAVHVQLEGGLANAVARRLRLGDPAVYPRVGDNAVILDARTILAEQIAEVGAAVGRAMGLAADTI